MTVALMSVSAVQQDVFAKDAGMSLTATAEEGGTIISLTGETTANNGAVTFTVKTPDGANLQAIGQETPDENGEFSTEFNTSNWNQNGMYSIKAIQGESLLYTVVLYVEVIDRMTLETNLKDKKPWIFND